MKIDPLKDAIGRGAFRVTDHADEEMAADGLSLSDVTFSVQNGEIIEEHPTDRPLPSCLVYGQSESAAHIHSVWAYNEQTGRAVLVTVYRPDPNRWVNWRKRR